MRFAFIIMTEFQKYQQGFTLYQLITHAIKKGHEIVGIFCYGSGIMNLKKNLHLDRNDINFPQLLNGLSPIPPIYACQTWADNYGLTNDDIIEHASITGLGELSEMTKMTDKLIVFGMHG